MQYLIIGAGYTAKFLYTRLKETLPGSNVHTLNRSLTFLDNAQHIVADLDKPESLDKLAAIATSTLTIYYLAPPKPVGTDEKRVSHFIEHLQQHEYTTCKIIYLSTSGVYGNKNGGWVTEETPTAPTTERAKRRISAEQQWLNINDDTADCVVLRVPGIYGPGRLPIEKIKQHRKIIDEAECGYTNLIHVEDLVSICLATAANGQTGHIYNISDTQPVKSSYYYKLVAKLAQLAPPEEVSLQTALASFDHKRLSFLTESRRLNVDKMLSTLKPELLYTNLEDGIKQAMPN